MLDSIEIGDRVYECIENPAERACFVIHYYWGLTFTELSVCFNTTEAAVEYMIRNAKSDVEKNYRYKT